MAQRLRIVNYAVNGSGAGHLTRLVAINRWVRRYAQFLGAHVEQYFLTSSEADALLFHEQFASFKLPSKTVVGETGIDKLAYLALAKQWVWHSLGLLQPDLLVVDTFPRGSFGELLSALDLCRNKAFVHRPVKEEFARRPDFQAMLPLYDLILVPEYEAQSGIEASPRLLHTGPVAVRERAELRTREDARRELGIAPGRLAVYVSAGGGGDPGAAEQLALVAQALLAEAGGDAQADGAVHLVIGAGPLYRGRPLHGERITWLTQPGAAELMPAYDLAVCAAGYNTFQELMLAGVPAVFLPQDKIADEQDLRAGRAEQAGAALRLPREHLAALGAGASAAQVAAFGAALRTLVGTVRDPAVRAARSEAARALCPHNHARDAAAALLRLVLPGQQVDAAQAAIDDTLLSALRSESVDYAQLLDVMHALAPPREAQGGPLTDAAAAELTARSVELVRAGRTHGLPVSLLARLARLGGPKLGSGSAGERARALEGLVAALGSFADWPAALSLVKLLVAERGQPAAVTAREITGFLEALRARGEDLYRGIAYLSAVHGSDSPPQNNRELLRAARGRMARGEAA